VVLEFDGPAWRAALAEGKQQLEALRAKIETGEATLKQYGNQKKLLEQREETESRLVAVNVGMDPADLRARYPDTTRYLITSAEVRMWAGLSWSPEEQTDLPVAKGYLRILASRIQVSLQHRAALQSVLGEDVQARERRDPNAQESPRYAVVLNYGARYEPWVEEFRAMGE
jgi:hypothetical protein